MSQSGVMMRNWQLAKYGEHVMNCQFCRPIEGRYCEIANQLSDALYGEPSECQVVVRQSDATGFSHRQYRRFRRELLF